MDGGELSIVQNPSLIPFPFPACGESCAGETVTRPHGEVTGGQVSARHGQVPCEPDEHWQFRDSGMPFLF